MRRLWTMVLLAVGCSREPRQHEPEPPPPVLAVALPMVVDASVPPAAPPPRMVIKGTRKSGTVLDCEDGCGQVALASDLSQLTFAVSPGMNHHFIFTMPSKRWRRGDTPTMDDVRASGGFPRFFPDNQTLLLRSPLFDEPDDGGAPPSVVVVPLHGGALVIAKGGDPTWPMASPDGTQVVFERQVDNHRELALVDIDGRHLRSLGLGTAPEWSPDGKHIAFVVAGDLWIIELAKPGQGRPVFTGGGKLGHPTWSPDGQFIAFARHRDAAADLVAVHADGSDRVETSLGHRGQGPFWASDGFIYYSDGATLIRRFEPVIAAPE